MNPGPVIRAALRRYRVTALVFVLLVAVGVALSVAILSQERALRTGSARAADRFDLVVAAPGSQTDALLTAVYLQPGAVRLLAPEVTAALLNDDRPAFASPLAFGDSLRGSPVVGAIPALVAHLSGGLAEGRVFAARTEAVVGAASPLRLGDRFRPTHGVHAGAEEEHDGDDGHESEEGHAEHGDGHDVELTVVGRMQPTGSPWDRAIVVPVELVWAVHGLPDGHAEGEARIGPPFDPARTPGIPAAVLHARDVAGAYRLRQAYATDESMAFFPAEALIRLYGILGDLRRLMALLAIVTQALVLLALVASTVILLRLLTPQFVTLRALGAPRRYVFAVAWGFTAALVAAGVLLGLGGGWALSFAISRALAAQTGIALQPTLGAAELWVALAVLLTGFALAALPAWLIQRRPLAEALAVE
ncbi:FtsX-like permease family protein [Inquilinus sp. Marseille-Q2685]|uniref:FtsX-like permease family protein n=1 Tax=Inquilinus sp. Marseille-Q2685 TaxID=2866581 RepID=UPI001CE3C1A3|nr:FtsX-like permease family protein [Inquilinus sp. Marseille-Q2685]